MSKPPTPSIADLEDALDRDVLSCDMNAVDHELEHEGIDPDRIARWGLAIARQRFEEKRLAWQSRARRRLQHVRGLGFADEIAALPDDREALLAIALRLRHELGAPAEMAFRKRAPETADPDELKMLIEELMLLKALPPDVPDDEDA